MSTQSYDPARPFTIGTRGSPLALAQAVETRARLMAAHGMAEEQFAIKVIKTTGDVVQDRPLSEIGGKGLFTKEIEEELLAGTIDIAVHSMKDVPTVLPDGLYISTVLPREAVCDAFISKDYASIEELPQGAVFGSSSLRRRAQLLAIRPDLQMVEFRGNVQTRLRKLDEGVAVATLLARAGLNRLEQTDLGADVPETTLLPAIAQGAVGIEQRMGDQATLDLLSPIHHAETAIRISAERAFLFTLDGSCRTPIAGLATLDGQSLHFTGEVLRPDGSEVVKTSRTGSIDEAEAMGKEAGLELISNGASGFF